eukprot:SAG31_NODE_16562_length_704_cov_0.859504_1_plen_52_part_00
MLVCDIANTELSKQVIESADRGVHSWGVLGNTARYALDHYSMVRAGEKRYR